LSTRNPHVERLIWTLVEHIGRRTHWWSDNYNHDPNGLGRAYVMAYSGMSQDTIKQARDEAVEAGILRVRKGHAMTLTPASWSVLDDCGVDRNMIHPSWSVWDNKRTGLGSVGWSLAMHHPDGLPFTAKVLMEATGLSRSATYKWMEKTRTLTPSAIKGDWLNLREMSREDRGNLDRRDKIIEDHKEAMEKFLATNWTERFYWRNIPQAQLDAEAAHAEHLASEEGPEPNFHRGLPFIAEPPIEPVVATYRAA
jgi:hypothetical protein